MLPMLHPEVVGIQAGKGQTRDDAAVFGKYVCMFEVEKHRDASGGWDVQDGELAPEICEAIELALYTLHACGAGWGKRTTRSSSMMLHGRSLAVELVVGGIGKLGLGAVETARGGLANRGSTQRRTLGSAEEGTLRKHGRKEAQWRGVGCTDVRFAVGGAGGNGLRSRDLPLISASSGPVMSSTIRSRAACSSCQQLDSYAAGQLSLGFELILLLLEACSAC